ncbi:hypothetical protein [Sulfobacillus thermosulfidooxidans]|uniref:hypothetical protein n=1 Tax=Sulfobacillus thermosulfidooxidans TaxID=28034 RepID=UPI00096BB8A8|nr:hypothetical protein [Sulfobacillus thermosulfidooxidans]OLZ09052.1 hypothetical protein BFX05_02295 [Sulfobacillus thermosulfidooxidans]OLZ15194.1 hypothetical protein BFX06_04450 [Sulfobacillus thermosulfidooxidans]OLZ22183.1 hypothetical protein BFX07_09970 [Sulfobacillus thermosulfidooxidans]
MKNFPLTEFGSKRRRSSSTSPLMLKVLIGTLLIMSVIMGTLPSWRSSSHAFFEPGTINLFVKSPQMIHVMTTHNGTIVVTLRKSSYPFTAHVQLINPTAINELVSIHSTHYVNTVRIDRHHHKWIAIPVGSSRDLVIRIQYQLSA